MTKRAAGKYERRDKDFYATPEEPILKLMPHLEGIDVFGEPMCGDGAIIRVLEAHGWICGYAGDLEPRGDVTGYAYTRDVLDLTTAAVTGCDALISNPPWPLPSNKRMGASEGSPTVPIIEHLMALKPTWLLLAADFMHNRYFEPLAPFCTKTVSVGRVSWMHNSKKGYDNAVWYRFDAKAQNGPDWFIPNREVRTTYHPDIENILG